MSKYIMAYFIGHLIEKYGQIPIQLQNATNNIIKFNVKSCKRMRTQVKSLITKTIVQFTIIIVRVFFKFKYEKDFFYITINDWMR